MMFIMLARDNASARKIIILLTRAVVRNAAVRR